MLFVGGIALAGISAPILAPYDPLAQNAFLILSPPSPEHWFGTDSLGRDVFSRVLYGAGLTLSIGFVASMFAMIGGSIVGVSAGYLGRITDYTLMRTTDALLAFPALLLALAILAGVGPGFLSLTLAIGIIYFPSFALLSRMLTLREREEEYVAAGISFGATKAFVLRRHILPNIFPGILAHLSITLPLAVLTEAALSFLGFSPNPAAPSWGRMIQESSLYLFAPHAAIAPMVALSLTVLSLQVIARSAQKVFDPTSQDNAQLLANR